jgi:hypothetical protein
MDRIFELIDFPLRRMKKYLVGPGETKRQSS